MGGRVFVLDVGRSFEKTVKLLEESISNFLPIHPSALILFPLFLPMISEAASDALAMLKPILSLMAAPKEGTRILKIPIWNKPSKMLGIRNTSKQQLRMLQLSFYSITDPIAKSLGRKALSLYRKGNLWEIL